MRAIAVLQLWLLLCGCYAVTVMHEDRHTRLNPAATPLLKIVVVSTKCGWIEIRHTNANTNDALMLCFVLYQMEGFHKTEKMIMEPKINKLCVYLCVCVCDSVTEIPPM